MTEFPQIVTFYSFKGGVGRSMALLNLAYALALRGRSVLLLDMDLEAPGLSGFLRRNGEVGAFANCDILDLLIWARDKFRAWQPDKPIERAALLPLSDFVVHVPPEKLGEPIKSNPDLGRVDIIPVDEGRELYRRLAECEPMAA